MPQIFTGGLIVGCGLLYWNQLMDSCLMPRIVFGAIWILIFLPLVFELVRGGNGRVNALDLFFGTYVIFHFISIPQSLVMIEACYEALRISLSFFIYIIFKSALQQGKVKEDFLIKTVFVIAMVQLGFGVSQLIDLISIMKPEGDNLYMINGISGHKNFLSAFLFTSSFLMAVGAVKWKGIWRLTSFVFIIAALIMIFMLQTRSVFLSMLVSGAVMVTLLVLIGVKNLRYLLLRFSAIFIILIVFLSVYGLYTDSLLSIVERLDVSTYLRSATGLERLSVWFKSSLLLKDHWLWGVGGRNWTIVYPGYGLSGMFRMQYLQTVFLQPHNDFLWVWCEHGIFGIIAFVGIFVAAFTSLFKKIRTTTNHSDRLILVLLFGWQAGFMVFSFFDFPRERMEHLMLVSLCWSIIAHRTHPTDLFAFEKQKLNTAYVGTALLVALIVLTSARMRSESFIKELNAAESSKDIRLYAQLAATYNTPLAPLDQVAVPKFYHEGVAAYALGDFQKAHECFQKAYELTPYNFNVLNNLGGMETYFQHYDKALNTYSEALRINPKNDDTRFNVSYTLYLLQQYDSALAVLQPVWSNKARKAEFDSIIIAAKSLKH